MNYCKDLFAYQRRKSAEVAVGNTPLGGTNPIRVQSMTTTNTLDTEATVAQCIRIFEAGGNYVRITAQGVQEAENLAHIRNLLTEKGFTFPLVADIHFNPKAAEVAAHNVEKVRINPGNFAERRPEGETYTDAELAEGHARVVAAVKSFIAICKANNTAVRIGVNHGSLSERMVSRFGDTPTGMVESALEFLRIFKDENFHNLAISMKSSNTRVMVQSVRLLVARMEEEGMHYPLHLGVTEAGNSREGRIKSAVGIGTLLSDGIGDTIRVSLTEEPEFEIPVARKLVAHFEKREAPSNLIISKVVPIDPYTYARSTSSNLGWIGGNTPPVVMADLTAAENPEATILDLNEILAGAPLPDLFLCSESVSSEILNASRVVIPQEKATDQEIVLLNAKSVGNHKGQALLEVDHAELTDTLIAAIKENPTLVMVLRATSTNPVAEFRSMVFRLREAAAFNPTILKNTYLSDDIETVQLQTAADFGSLLLDGVGDGISLDAPNIPFEEAITTAFDSLQAARVRTTKTEYISCPGCGRTLYNLQQTAGLIKARTCHLKGLKIGIMGCIVNGPGEMADADYGYVGAGPGKINLYKRKELIKRNIPQTDALEELINLIKENGDWKEK